MSQILVSLVGGRMMPNVIAALHFTPEKLIYLISNDYSEYESVQNVISEALPTELQDRIESFHFVDPFDIEASKRVSAQIVQDNPGQVITFNLTSGTKQMALGCYDTIKNLRLQNKHNLDLCFINREGIVQGSSAVARTAGISLQQYFRCYGWEITSKGIKKKQYNDMAAILAENLPVANDLLYKLRRKMHGSKQSGNTAQVKLTGLNGQEVKILSQMKQANLICVNIGRRSADLSFNDPMMLQFISSGNWLEYYTFLKAKEFSNFHSGLLSDFAWGVTDTKNKSGEIDFAAMFRGQLILVSCKAVGVDSSKVKEGRSSQLRRISVEWLNELNNRAEQLGKGMCAKVFITSVHRRRISNLSAMQLRARERQISFVCGDELPKLEQVFLKIVRGDPKAEPQNVNIYKRI